MVGLLNSSVTILSLGRDKPIEKLQGHTSAVYSVDYSSNGGMIVSGSDDETIKIWVQTCRLGHYGIFPNCEPCPPGSYKVDAKSDVCLPCSAGFLQNLTGLASCMIYEAGTYQFKGNQTSCEPCRSGGYCPSSEAVEARGGGFVLCPKGTYNNQTKQTDVSTCDPCPAGECLGFPYWNQHHSFCYNLVHFCSTGTFSDGIYENPQCLPCTI